MSRLADAAPGEAAASELERLSRELLACLTPAGDEKRYTAPQSGSWSAIEVLAHAVEFVPYWAEQAAGVSARDDGGDRPFGRTHDDPARIAAVREHTKDRYEALALRLDEVVRSSTTTLRAIPREGWTRTAVHARRGSMSVEQIVRQFLLDHLTEHTAQAAAAVARNDQPAEGDMTKVFHCGELKEGCAEVIRGSSTEDVVAQAKRHAEKEHGHTEHPADKVAQVIARIRDE
ncbi:MAG: DinB family protein [Candidatus Limnocylindria bacterium]